MDAPASASTFADWETTQFSSFAYKPDASEIAGNRMPSGDNLSADRKNEDVAPNMSDEESDDDDGWMMGDPQSREASRQAVAAKKKKVAADERKKKQRKMQIVDSDDDDDEEEDYDDGDDSNDDDDGDDDNDDDDDEIIDTPLVKRRKGNNEADIPSARSNVSGTSTVEILQDSDSDDSAAMVRATIARNPPRSTPYAMATPGIVEDLTKDLGKESNNSSSSGGGGGGRKGGLLRKKNSSSSSSRLNEVDVDGSRDPMSSVKKARKRKSSEARSDRVERREKHVVNLANSDDNGNDDDDDAADNDNGSDDDSDSDSDGGRYATEERTKEQSMRAADAIMTKCREYSDKLRSGIAGMMKSKSATGDDDGNAGGDGDDNGGMLAISDNAIAATVLRTTTTTSSGGGGGDGGGGAGEVLSQGTIDQYCSSECVLKAYQLVGVNWLKLLHEHNLNGVLADDMGLGKTVQTIAFLGWLKHNHTTNSHGGNSHLHLVVVPASTLSNWQKELQRFCPGLVVKTYHGSQDERHEIRREVRRNERWECDVVLSTYTIFERESNADDRKFLYKHQFSYLVLDEAHALKNANSQRFTNLNNLVARRRLLLSGTPVQNNLSELLSILSFLMPKLFRPSACETLMEAYGWSSSDSGGRGGGSEDNKKSIRSLRTMLVPFVLRRMKAHVLDQLVTKVSELVKVTLAPRQFQVYDGVLCGYAARKERIKTDNLIEKTATGGLGLGKSSYWNTDSDNATSGTAAATSTSSSSTSTSCGDGKAHATTGRASRRAAAAAPPSYSELASDRDWLNDLTRSSSTGSIAESVNGVPEIIDMTDITSPSRLSRKDLVKAADTVQELSAKEAKHLFTALRKAANHPLLLRARYVDDDVLHKISQVCLLHQHFGRQCEDIARVRQEVESFSDFGIHQICCEYTELSNHTLPGDALYDSPKFEKLREMLPDLVDSGNHILVFSQWTRILDLLEVLMEDLDLPFLRLDGSTAVRERQALIDQFNSGAIPVFLLSTKAGGLGINLCQANYVIMHDLDFNPENDRQAEDRAHRIGQTREVHVLKLVTGETVDEDIYAMGERKKRLSEAVLSNTAGAKTAGGGSSKGGAAGDDGDGDIGAIGKILQRALIKKADRGIAAAAAAAGGDGEDVPKKDTTAGAGDEHKEEQEQKERESAVAVAVDLDVVAPPLPQANKRDKKVAPKRVVNLLDSDSD